jgi:hypothetical protein
MKWLVLVLLSICSFLACSPGLRLQEYRGSDVFEGQGGVVETTDGIDFWTSGTPDCKFKLLGVIHLHPGSYLVSALAEKDLIQKVIDMGGNGVILISKESRPAGFTDMGFGQAAIDYSEDYRYAVVKYLK